jgi:4-hydroxythreonine-4-phosphate dehydrogenase
VDAPASRRSVRRVQALIRIALTSGEPAGIGPELCLAIAREKVDCELVCLGDRTLLAERAAMLKLPVTLTDYDANARAKHSPDGLKVLHVPLSAPSTPGKLDPANGRYVINLLDRAIDGAVSGEFDAIVTAPVQKSVINDAGIPFTGHTEYLAERTRAALPVMMLATEDLRVALATTHLPLKDVSAAITVDSLCEVLTILDHDLRQWWGLKTPRIAVCGLNPHAGENGHLGREDGDVIAPAIARARASGLLVDGPLPADTVFVPRNLSNYDVVLAMYHDQGLPVLKHAGFGHAVNVTLGLPIVRTSVDHGTALDLAATGRADAGSLVAATRLAVEFSARAGEPRA